MIPSKWDRRIQRAEELEKTYPFAAEVLQFYKRLAALQKGAYFQFEGSGAAVNQPSGEFRDQLNLRALASLFPKFLSDLKAIATKTLAQSAQDLQSQRPEQWQSLLQNIWDAADFQPKPNQPEALMAWFFLQPYAEYIADRKGPVISNGSKALCPRCSGRPQVGVLRQEGDGAKRSLICSLCATEWAYGRILCPSCGNENVEQLAVYSSPQFDHVRVEGCDACRHYIKTVDLTRNGLAIPVVDELATIPLNLWALEHGYVKLQANLLGI